MIPKRDYTGLEQYMTGKEKLALVYAEILRKAR